VAATPLFQYVYLNDSAQLMHLMQVKAMSPATRVATRLRLLYAD